MPIAADALISYSALGQGAGNAVPPPLSLYVRALINFQTKKITFKITNAHLSCVDLTTKAAATGQTNVSVAVRACVRAAMDQLLTGAEHQQSQLPSVVSFHRQRSASSLQSTTQRTSPSSARGGGPGVCPSPDI